MPGELPALYGLETAMQALRWCAVCQEDAAPCGKLADDVTFLKMQGG